MQILPIQILLRDISIELCYYLKVNIMRLKHCVFKTTTTAQMKNI